MTSGWHGPVTARAMERVDRTAGAYENMPLTWDAYDRLKRIAGWQAIDAVSDLLYSGTTCDDEYWRRQLASPYPDSREHAVREIERSRSILLGVVELERRAAFVLDLLNAAADAAAAQEGATA